MFISWSSNKNPSNNYLSSNIHNLTDNSDQFLVPHQNKRTTSFLVSNSLNNANKDTNSSSQIFQHDNITINSSFLSECENDFDFLTRYKENQLNPFESLDIFMTYYNKLSNKTDVIQSLIQNRIFFLSLLKSQNGIDIILYILKQNPSLSLYNIVIYYISFLSKNHQRNLSKLFTYLFHYGNTFIKNQIISLTHNI